MSLLTYNLNYTHHHHNKFITSTYFNTFNVYRYVFINLDNTIKTNLLKSLKYLLLRQLDKSTSEVKSKLSHQKLNTYPLSVTSVTTPTSKTATNKFLFFILNLVLSNYKTQYNFFEVKTSSLPLSINLQFFTFINLFYFKIRNY
jgi:hypothetical protein